MLVAMLCAFFTGTVWGADETITFSEQGYTNQQAITTVNGTNFTIAFDKGSNSNAPKYYTSGTAIRAYGGNTFTVSSSTKTIEKIEITFGSSDGSNEITAGVGTYDSGTWTGSATSVTFTIGGTSGNRRLSAIAVTYSGGSTEPSIEASNVDIAYDATSGSIAYTITNPTSETLSAITNSDWLSLGTVGASPISFTCSTNPDKTPRTATVTLTYGSVTKSVTVTQAGNPNVVDNISDINVAGTYSVRGTIVAKSQRGFIVGDGTGYVYYYNQNYTQADYNIGDKVQLSGSVVAYGGVFEFNNSTTITAATESNYVAEEPTALTGAQMDTRVGSTTPAQLSSFVQYEGILSVSGNYYNITNIDGASTARGSISYPLTTDFASLNGKLVNVTGYYVGVSSSQYYNTMIGSIEEVVSTTPIINLTSAAEIELAYDATSGEITYSIVNPTEGKTLSATSTADWISNIVANDGTVSFTTTANDGTANRTATITLAYDGAESVTVTVTQKYFVADYATLPFEFNGGKSDFETTAGLTQSGLGTDYDDAPKMKFDGTGDYVVLKFNERPGTLTFDIKGNGFSGGTFKVQTSADGETYTDLETYTTITGTQSESFNNLGADVRYIKWVYTEKSSGNVALGNIKLAKYVAPVSSTLTIPTVDNVNITAAYNTDDILEEGESAEIEQNTVIILTVDASEGYTVKSVTVTGPDEQSFAPTAVTDSEGAYRFTMPAYNATISVTVEEYVAPETATYVLATEIVSGKNYVIASGTEGSVKVMGDQSNNNRPAVVATITDGKLSVSDAYEFVIESATVGEVSGYSIYDAGENGYLYAASSSSNHLKTQDTNDENGIWAITIGEDGVASIVAQGANTRKVMQFNPNESNNNPLFACYSSASQSPVYLFVKEETEPETVPVTVSAAGYATFCSDKALDFTNTEIKAFIGTRNGTSLVFNKINKVPANTGVLLYKVDGATENVPVVEAGDDATGNCLVGVTAETTINADDYILSLNSSSDGVGFYKAGTYTTLGANRAYIPATAAVGVKSFAIQFDVAVGIEDLNANNHANEGIFNLAGQRVSKMNRGIYVINGKKVMVK